MKLTDVFQTKRSFCVLNIIYINRGNFKDISNECGFFLLAHPVGRSTVQVTLDQTFTATLCRCDASLVDTR